MTQDAETVASEGYEYRILCKKPGKRTWEYIRAIGMTSSDPVRLTKRMILEQEQNAGWQFKMEQQKVVTVTTRYEWEPYKP